ncbi:hypothetical protein BC834DRAFT_938413 [Gloeopeniophorella convolvens]|nr:hypothetical protein BC834DRAFT_938413 [Gloeopeniophorella convolvens]
MLDEIRQMRLEDVALVTTVRETIRTSALELASPDVPEVVKEAQAHLLNPRADSSALFKSLTASAHKGKRGQGRISIRDVALQKTPQGRDWPGVFPHLARTRTSASGQPAHPIEVPRDPSHLPSLDPFGSSDVPVVAQGAKQLPAENPLPAEKAARPVTVAPPADQQAPPPSPKDEPCAARAPADTTWTTEVPRAATDTWVADVPAENPALRFDHPTTEGGIPVASGTNPAPSLFGAATSPPYDGWGWGSVKGVKKGQKGKARAETKVKTPADADHGADGI